MEGVTFRYIVEGVQSAKKDGFRYYPEFQFDNIHNVSTYDKKIWDQGVLEIFSHRLTRSEREDKKRFYDFWEIEGDREEDILYMLAYTGGITPLDEFEILAEFHPKKELHFVSELANVFVRNIPAGLVNTGDKLKYELEPNNQYDKYAVKIFSKDDEIGYIKLIHNRIFHRTRHPLVVEVKHIEEREIIEKIFVRISY